MKRLLVVLVCFCSSLVFGQATCSQTDVTNAVNAAASGATVTVPAGTCAWSGPITVTLAIHIQGAGSGATIISGGRFRYTPLLAEVNKVFEVNGFTFQNATNLFSAGPPDYAHPITGLKIHDNIFQGGSQAILLGGGEFGVFYNNTFTGNSTSIFDGGCGTGTGAAGTCEAYAHVLGTANYPYFENNTFTACTGGFAITTQSGGRSAFRHNTVTHSCVGGEVADFHGDQGDSGSISTEFYHNTIDVGTTGNRWAHHRGGGAVFLNNTISYSVTGVPAFNFTEYHAWNSSFGGCIAYLAPGQINNVAAGYGPAYYANNLANGVLQIPTYTAEDGPGGVDCGFARPDGVHEASSFIVLGRDYYRPTSGLEAALPATCTIGDNYATTDTDKIAHCKALNTWSYLVADGGYTPYTYPHPLASGGSAPVATLSASSSVVKSGGTFTLTWTCSNTPTSASIDQSYGTASPASGGTTSAITVLAGSTTYTITCSNASGNGTASATVTQGGVTVRTNTKHGRNSKFQ